MTVFVTVKFYESKINSSYQIGSFIIDSEKKIKTTLKKLSDNEGLKTKNYKVNVTNNGDKKEYKILLSPIIENDSDIRLAINNNVVRNLSSFDKEDNSYVIYTSPLSTSYTSINNIKIWQKQDSTLNNLKVNFEIKVKID